MDPIDWLLEGDPALRWQAMRDLADEPCDQVASERSRVAVEGWGARLLELQSDDGQWGGGSYSPKWTSTTYTLLLLRHLGIDPASPAAQAAIDRVHERVEMRGGTPFFSYTGETCIAGMVLALGSYFRLDRDVVDEVVAWLVSSQKDDGGWNCDSKSTRSSFNSTISVLEGLLEYQQSHADAAGTTAPSRQRGDEYLLARRMFRSLSSGDVVNARWKLLSFPPRWHYDLLRGLDYIRATQAVPDHRCEEAIAIVESKRTTDGRWPLQNVHRGRQHFEMEAGAGKPSRWNTLRALRVLRWYRCESAVLDSRTLEH